MIFLVPCAWLLLALRTALNVPAGYEDQDGFHYGEQHDAGT